MAKRKDTIYIESDGLNAKPPPVELQCKYHTWIECDDKSACKKCGWDPVVEHSRMNKNRRELGMKHIPSEEEFRWKT